MPADKLNFPIVVGCTVVYAVSRSHIRIGKVHELLPVMVRLNGPFGDLRHPGDIVVVHP